MKVSLRKLCVFEYEMLCDHTTCVTFPLPLIISDSMWMLRFAATVTTTSPLSLTVPVVVVVAKAGAFKTVIFPVVGRGDGSVTTCSTPDTNQF